MLYPRMEGARHCFFTEIRRCAHAYLVLGTHHLSGIGPDFTTGENHLIRPVYVEHHCTP